MVKRLALAILVSLVAGTGCLRPPLERTPYPEHTDAGGLTCVEGTKRIALAGSTEAIEAQLAALVREASASGSAVSIAGARHSMGGHTLYPGAVVLDMTGLDDFALLADGEKLRTGAGAKWSAILPYLHERGRSVAIMQSNNDFTVGGSVSVNCHGWQVRRPPIADSVHSLRLLRADGTVLRCSRTENAELFRHALGGYGLFGVIVEVDLQTVPNRVLASRQTVTTPEDFDALWSTLVDANPRVELAYGRLSVDRAAMFREAILATFEASESDALPGPLPTPGALSWLKRQVFRWGAHSDAGKRLRWAAEKNFGEAEGELVSRNQLLNEPSSIYAEQDPERTDVLHEYFVPRARLPQFLERAREPILRHRGNLMNVTIRHVLPDLDTALPFATEESFSFVFLFNYDRSEEPRYAALTRDLIDVALACGGRYYLPYRLDATEEQFLAAYPMAPAFFAAKRREDPNALFRNMFWERYAGLSDRTSAPAPP